MTKYVLLVLGPIGIVILLLMAIIGGGTVAAGGAAGSMAGAIGAVAQPPDGACTPGIGGTLLPTTADQDGHARNIIGVGKGMGFSRQGQIVALMVALQESSLLNYANDGGNVNNYQGFPAPGTSWWLNVAKMSLAEPHEAVGRDADSVGLFQQRAAAGWAGPIETIVNGGEAEQRAAIRRLMNDQYSASKFYERLGTVSGWEGMAKTVAAQRVQGSAFPDAYADDEPQATALLNRLDSSSPSIAPAVPVSTPSPGGSTGPGITLGGCGTGGGNLGGTGTVAAILAAGSAVMGTPYSWGGGTLNGPSEGFAQGAGIIGFDCSSLMMYMVYQGTGGANGGIIMPRTATPQHDDNQYARPIPVSDIQPGDLVFWGGPGNWHHVAMYVGNMQVINAPSTGNVVRLQDITYWMPQGAARLNLTPPGGAPAPAN